MDSAYKYYMRAHDEDSTNPIFTNNLGTTFYNSSIPLSTKAEQFQRLGMMDSAQYYARVATDKLLSALPYFLKAHQGDSTETDFINNVGCIYGATQRPDSAIYWFNKAYKTDSLDLISIQFLDITYRALGKTAEADYYKARAAQVRQIRTQQFE
jgi:Tfp pilus assembly protein PilF